MTFRCSNCQKEKTRKEVTAIDTPDGSFAGWICWACLMRAKRIQAEEERFEFIQDQIRGGTQ